MSEVKRTNEGRTFLVRRQALYSALPVSGRLFPYPDTKQLTFWTPRSPDSKLAFSLPGQSVFFGTALICASTFWGYRVVAGKVEDYQGGLLMLKRSKKNWPSSNRGKVFFTSYF